MKRVKWIFYSLLGVWSSFSSPAYGVGKEEPPYFSGNIIAYSASTIPKGVFETQVYLYATRIRGVYDSDNRLSSDRNVQQYQAEVEFGYGIAQNIDLNLEVYAFLIHNNGRETTQWGDTRVYIGFQLLEMGPNRPAIKFQLGELFPTGKYQGLNPTFRGGDGVGMGAFQTYLAFLMGKAYVNGKHPWNWKINLFYILSTPVDISGPNVYIIDDPGIKGVIIPGVQFDADLAFEYKFNRPWGAGLDIYLTQRNSSPFEIRRGSRLPSVGGVPSTHTLSLAPSLEYNINDKFNMLAGVWFSVAGRNTLAFTSLIYSVYYQF